MARLNITISDELYAALQTWRDRINISKICQEAIAKEVAKLEDLPRQAVELETLIDRLREEKAQSDKTYFLLPQAALTAYYLDRIGADAPQDSTS